jgi:isoquinoline 1-oxidoreductase beta subunit
MEKTNTNFNRRAFLKASALAGGGLMIQFSALAKWGLPKEALMPLLLQNGVN